MPTKNFIGGKLILLIHMLINTKTNQFKKLIRSCASSRVPRCGGGQGSVKKIDKRFFPLIYLILDLS